MNKGIVKVKVNRSELDAYCTAQAEAFGYDAMRDWLYSYVETVELDDTAWSYYRLTMTAYKAVRKGVSMPSVSNEPFSLDEIKGVLEIYEGLHGQDLGRSRFQIWLEGKPLNEEAYDFIVDLYHWRKK